MTNRAKPLLLVGASARAAAHSAKRAGYIPLAIDLFADADLAECCRVERWDYRADSLLRIASQFPDCGWLYTGALENQPQLVESLAAERPLYGNRQGVLSAVRDPWRLTATLQRHHFPAAAVSQARQDGDWISKPLRSAGGQDVALLDAQRRSGAPRRSAYYQQYIPGPSFAAVYVAGREGAELLGVTQQLVGAAWTGASGFRYCGSIGPVRMRERVRQEFHRLGSVLAEEFGLSGLFGIDTVVNEDGVWTVEVNPRYTASVEILERANDFAAIRLHVAACLDQIMPAGVGTAEDGCYGKAILYARRDVCVSATFSQLVSRWNAGRAWPAVADIPLSGSKVREGGPVTTVFAQAPTRDLVEAELQRLARELQDVLSC